MTWHSSAAARPTGRPQIGCRDGATCPCQSELLVWQRQIDAVLLLPTMPIPPLCRLLHDDQKESGLLPILARLIKQFDHRVQSRDHAHDLVQCLHVVLRMLERLGREGEDERFASVAESLMLLLKLACPCLCLCCLCLLGLETA